MLLKRTCFGTKSFILILVNIKKKRKLRWQIYLSCCLRQYFYERINYLIYIFFQLQFERQRFNIRDIYRFGSSKTFF